MHLKQFLRGKKNNINNSKLNICFSVIIGYESVTSDYENLITVNYTYTQLFLSNRNVIEQENVKQKMAHFAR